MLLVPAFLPSAVSAAAPRASGPQTFVLSLSDVQHYFGKGFTQSMHTAMTKKQVDIAASSSKLPGVSFTAHGFVSGYVVGFNKKTGLTSFKNGKLTVNPGVIGVTSAVMGFKSDAGPKWEFAYTHAHPLNLKGVHLKYQSLSGVGDQALLVSTSTKVGSIGTINAISVEWRHGSYSATLSLDGYGAIKTADVVAVAKTMDSRISHAG
jgi:hypothetical protein